VRRFWCVRQEVKKLRCVECSAEFPLGPEFEGCRECRGRGKRSAIDVIYDYSSVGRSPRSIAGDGLSRGLWDFGHLLPVENLQNAVTLGEASTPLFRLPSLARLGLADLFLKNESSNPTGSYKDRSNAVTISVARELGLKKVVALTTGNFGCSLAAYAAAAGFECVVFCHEEASQAIVDLIQLFGARVVMGGPRAAFLEALVREGGWFPACPVTPWPEVCSPFGVEGFKTIPYEIFEQLGNATPEAVLMPVGSGDGFYGVWKGFRELKLLGLTDRVPRMYACQAEGSNPVVRSFRAGLQAVVGVPDPRSVALSIREGTSSSLALQAVYESAGEAIDCSEAEVEDTWQLLCHSGICVEASSAVPIACARKLLAAQRPARFDRVVCLLTGAGIKWPEFLAARSPRKPISGTEIAEPQAIVAALRDPTAK